jgi:hypothetical protein
MAAREGAHMIFRTDSKRVEVEYSRGYIFFVRFPLLGEVLWIRPEGWQFWPWRSVKAELVRQADERAVQAVLDEALDKAGE